MRKALASIVPAIIILSFIPEVRAIDIRHGTLTTSEVWSNSVLVDGDIILPEGVILEIKPGTRIILRQDRMTQNRHKLVIYGQLVANGTDSNPIKFEPEDSPSLSSTSRNEGWFKPSAWQGIVITGTASQGILTNCIIQSAYIGISVDSHVEVRKCKILQSELACIEGNSARSEIEDSQLAYGQYGIKGRFKELTATGNNIRKHQFGIWCYLESGHIGNNTIADNASAILLDTGSNNIEVYHNNIYRHYEGISIALRKTKITLSDNELVDIDKAIALSGEGVVYLQRNALRKCQYGIYVKDTSDIQVHGTINYASDPLTNSFVRITRATVHPYDYELQADQPSIPTSVIPRVDNSLEVGDSGPETHPIVSTEAKDPVIYYKSASDYIEGKMEGSLYARGEPAWVAAGACLGPLGVIIAYASPKSPPTEMLMDKNLEYTFGFTESYKSGSRLKNLGYAFGGWLSWVFIYYLVFAD